MLTAGKEVGHCTMYIYIDFNEKKMEIDNVNVVFTNKRSQEKVFTVYLSLAARHSYLEGNNYNVTLCTWSTNMSQYFTQYYTPVH